ncbi:MAG: hypothetical protein ACP5VE_00960 [Chthonomonadales bacterium]
MNFATLSPAERMKASALIGLIVVVMFFVVHTLLGVVAPKTRQVPAPVPSAGAPAPTPPASTPQAAPAPDFPTSKAIAARKEPEPEPPIPDPFTPLHAKGPVSNPTSAPAPAPKVDVSPIRPQPLPPIAAGSVLPGMPAELAKPAEERPEIRVIGIVRGDRSVATLEVQGQIMILHPGDAVAKGWRIQAIDDGSVWLQHGTELIGVRVGTAINRHPATP